MLLSLVSSFAQSQTPSRPPPDQRYHVSHWNAEEGLPQNTARAFAQTPDGYIWVGTLAGLARFDGVKFTVFDHSNTPEMVHDAINSLAVDQQDGSLWIGTGSGLLQYSNRQFKRFRVRDEGPVGWVWAARGGGVWLPGKNGELARFRNGIIEKWQITVESEWSGVTELRQESSGSVLALCGGELYRCDPASGHVAHLTLPTDSADGGLARSFLGLLRKNGQLLSEFFRNFVDSVVVVGPRDRVPPRPGFLRHARL